MRCDRVVIGGTISVGVSSGMQRETREERAMMERYYICSNDVAEVFYTMRRKGEQQLAIMKNRGGRQMLGGTCPSHTCRPPCRPRALRLGTGACGTVTTWLARRGDPCLVSGTCRLRRNSATVILRNIWLMLIQIASRYYSLSHCSPYNTQNSPKSLYQICSWPKHRAPPN